MARTSRWALVVSLVASAGGAAHADESVWIEGEAADPGETTFNDHVWYRDADLRMDVLSPGAPGDADRPGDWLAHYTNSASVGAASWPFELGEGGVYSLWIRANPYPSSFFFGLDGATPELFDLAADDREWVNLRAPGIDIRMVSWSLLGVFELAAGSHRLDVRVEAHPSREDGQTHAGIDAIALANFPWAPTGGRRPDAPPPPVGEAPADAWFVYQPDDSSLDRPSLLDASALVEAPAGARGVLTRRGDAFVFADGTPVKLWGVGVGHEPPVTPAVMERQARFLRRQGVNAVRMHALETWLGRGQRDPVTGDRTFDSDRLDRLDRWFAAFKAQGLYVDWSLFFPHMVGDDEGYPADLYAELPEDRDPSGRSTYGIVNLMPALQDSQWEWARSLLSHVNPHTGLRYADDPALAIVEVHNEDCLFWHSPLNVLAAGEEMPLHTEELRRRWGEWLEAHGREVGDRELYGAWEMDADGPEFGGEAAAPRMGDFIRFLAEMQRAFYERRRDRLRALGFDGVVVSTAWVAGGPAAAAANLWADAALDAIDRHAYFGGGAGGHQIAVGEVHNASHLDELLGGVLAGGAFQLDDRPFVVSEWTSLPPNQWKAEAAPAFAFVGMGRQGWDGSFHFSSASPRMETGWPGLRSYVSETPHYLGQFPALSRAVHRGDVSQAPRADLPALADTDVFGGFDRRPPLGPGDLVRSRYALTFGDTPPEGAGVGDDEVVWDEPGRLLTVSAQRTQAAVGFFGGRTVELPDVTLTVDNEFASVLLTSLDDRPLRSAARVLVTALAQDREVGARYSPDGGELLALGGPPLLLEPVRMRLETPHRDDWTLTALSVDGERTGVEVRDARIDGRYRTFYYLLEGSPDPGAEGEGEGEGEGVGVGGEGAEQGGGEEGGGGGPGEGSDSGESSGDAPLGEGGRRDEGCGCEVGGPSPTLPGLRR